MCLERQIEPPRGWRVGAWKLRKFLSEPLKAEIDAEACLVLLEQRADRLDRWATVDIPELEGQRDLG